MKIRNACLAGDLDIAEELLTKDISARANNYSTYAIRSFVMARKHDWDRALHDALESVSILPSLAGYISQGIALCGKMHFQDAIRVFNLAFKHVNISLLFLFHDSFQVVMLFDANQRDDAILRVQQLAAARPNVDTLACSIVEGYLRLQINDLDGVHGEKTANNFTAVFNTIAGASKSTICSESDDFVLLFGWDLEFLWRTANQKRCDTLLRAGRLREAHESYRYIMDISDEAAKATYLDWSATFMQKCNALYAPNGIAGLAASGDTAFIAKDYDSTARCKKMLWEDAPLDAQKIIELDPSSYVGYQLKHAALHGAQRPNEAIEAFETMLQKLDDAPNIEIRKLRKQYVSPFEAELAVRRVIDAQMENTPPRLLNTSTGRLCDRAAQINVLKTTAEYNELLVSVMRRDVQMEYVQGAVETYFQYVMLSHRWEEKEPLLHDTQDKIVYDLDAVGGNVKLQSFCKTARDAGYHWAWSDTCCIDKNSNVELQESVNSMFVWYRRSALTIVYLSDVSSSSESGALAKSAWNTRGWTVQEFLAPKIVLFYQKDWTPYLGDRSPNHKDITVIMQEMGDATGIDAQALVSFRPGTRDAREKLQWASARATTLQEDIAYSLFGIFGVYLAPIYGEKKQNALGRLVQEIVAQSGDVSALDWVGKSSEFNSCLPAEITSYQAPSCMLPSLSEDEIQKSISSLQDAVVIESATRLYNELDSLSVARFAHRRLHLPCLVFPVTEIRSRHGQGQEIHFTYQVKANGLHDLLITTEDRLVQFWPGRPTLQTFFIVRPWNRDLLELPDFTELSDLAEPRSPTDLQGIKDQLASPTSPLHDLPLVSSGENGLVESEHQLRALRLIARLGEPFGVFLLAQQRGGEFRRMASEHDIIALVKDVASVHNMLEVRTLEIL
ncbi:heterokaryon incompatibility protein-domain-containing protein [Suillus spraguei]|nr:heterokaryon incompatibility protein-domain-containing protein [Suillus spraguei]